MKRHGWLAAGAALIAATIGGLLLRQGGIPDAAPPEDDHSQTGAFEAELRDSPAGPPLLDRSELIAHIDSSRLAAVQANFNRLDLSLRRLAWYHQRTDSIRADNPGAARELDLRAMPFRLDVERQIKLVTSSLTPEEVGWLHSYMEARAESIGLTHDVWSVEETIKGEGLLRGAGEHTSVPR